MAERSVVWHVTISLDGFIAGPDDAMDWVFEYLEPNPVADEVIEATGAVLAGRRSHDVGRREQQEVYGGAWKGPHFVLREPPPQEQNPAISFLGGGIEDAVATARATAGGRNVVLIGADAARQCLENDLVDEVVVHRTPGCSATGVRTLDPPAGPRVELERATVDQSGQLTARVPKEQCRAE
jgi:dihydrofolate reductase